MFRHIKRYLAIRSYMHRLAGELAGRFGRRPSYTTEQVSRAVERGGLSKAFVAYAHAAFCTPQEFEAYYEPLGVACNYLDLRRVIARRYFSGHMDFDAQTIFVRLDRLHTESANFYESGKGFPGAWSGR